MISEIESVEDAIGVIESQPVHLVLLDINLKKDKDGIDLGHYLLAKATLPFIYLTSNTDKITIDRASETRPQGYLIKPYRAVDLKTTVAIVLNNFSLRKIDTTRADEATSDTIPFILKKTIDYINENVNNHISIEELALQTSWSSQHFLRMFSKYVGLTPLKYITYRKIEKAKALLIETNIATRHISYEIGFTSHGNFCVVFKKLTGKTPDEYRKTNAVNKLR